MDRFLRLRKKFKFHKVKLTYRSLGRMSMYILGAFVIGAILLTKFTPVNESSHFKLLASNNYNLAEKEMIAYLTKNRDDVDVWRLLVRLRIISEKISVEYNSGEFSFAPDNTSDPTLKISKLSRTDFIQFLKTAENPTPEALIFRYNLYLNTELKEDNYHNRPLNVQIELLHIFREEGNFEKVISLGELILEQDKNNKEVREMVLLGLAVKRKIEDLQSKLNDPEWRPYFDHWTLHKYHLERKEFLQMFYHVTLYSFKNYTWKAYLTCGIAGLGWIILLIHLGSAWFWKKKEILLIPAAVILGMMSATTCLGVVIVQDFYLNHTGFTDKSVVYNLAYCILGIGLREELCKLFLFLPILYFVKNIREEYKILCFCSLVGLGFAIEENLSYFLRSSGDAVIVGRFLTANFAHTFLTGFTCFYLVKAVQRGGKAWDEFTITLVKMIVIHGVYDFLLIDPTMKSKGMGFFAMMIYVYVALLYLRLLMSTAPPAHQFVSLTRVFTIVLCCTIGITFMMLSTEIGIKDAFKSIASGMVVYAIYAYMFYREFNERIG